MKPCARTRITALLCWAFVSAPGTGHGVTRDEYTKQECATCHITWLDAFRTKGETVITEDWKPSFFKDTLGVVTSEDMCYSCHDGFVRDSRQRVWEGKGHSVGRKPSPETVVPPGMPLNQRGEVYCGTCHTPHGVGEQKAELTGSVFLRTENVDSRLCVLCHTSQMQGQGMKNHPVGRLAKEPLPEEIYWLGGRLGSDPRKVICQSCHTPHGKDTILKPVNDSSLCLLCHGDKNNPGPFLQQGRPLHPVGVIPGQEISQTAVFPQGARRGEGGRIICLTCHGVHWGQGPGVSLDPDPASFCQSCHPREAEILSKGKHNLRKTAPQAKNLDGKNPEESGPCRTCHRAHGWAQAGNPGADSLSSLCTGCHRTGGAAGQKTIGSISHPVNVEIDRMQEGSPLRLLESRGKKKVVCTTCHDPHKDRSYGQERFLGLQAAPSNQFLRDDREALCAQCHQDHLELKGTKHDFRRSLEYDDAPLRERLERWGPCGGCHMVHQAKQPFLWAMDPLPEPGPRGSLCANCHREDGCARKKPVARFNHPVGVPSLRDGPRELPLWRPSPASGEGVVACHTCHNPHRWDPAGGQADPSLEGSGLNSFLRVPNDTDSKLCVRCHFEKREVNGSDHDMLSVRETCAPGDPQVSNLCSGCHLPHGNDPARELWTWGLASDGTGTDRACLRCHSKGGTAEKKTVGTGHFTGEPRKKVSQNALPFYAAEPGGKKKLLLCATCHEPHRWSPGTSSEPREGPVNREGTGGNSFLRIPCQGDAPLCRTCHAEKGAVIGTEHDMRLVPGEPAAVLRPAIQRDGVCSPCHSPHNVSSSRFLWARELREGPSEQERICFSCHQSRQVAGGKVPPRYRHPDVRLPSASERANLPIRTGSAGKAWGEHNPEGGIRCFTCHDAHVWSLDPRKKQPGIPLEGDAGSSFLWKKSYEHFCNLCHGNEGLYRYLYFHRANLVGSQR